MICAPELILDDNYGVGSRFNVLRSRTLFRRCGGRRVPPSCLMFPDTFSAVARASGPIFMFCAPVFMFCAPRLIFGGFEGVGTRYHVLRPRNRFRRYLRRRVLFSCFALPNMFRRFRGRRVPFTCFALPETFSVVPWASGPVFMFCAPKLVFGGTVGVHSRFQVLRFGTHYRRCGGHRVLFSYFALPGTLSAVRRASDPIFMFCAPRLFSAVPRASGPVFMFYVPGHVIGGAEGVGSLFMFCAPRLVFGGSEGVGTRFNVLPSLTHFRRFEVSGSHFHVLHHRTRFWR
jgi:hypothetical protein